MLILSSESWEKVGWVCVSDEILRLMKRSTVHGYGYDIGIGWEWEMVLVVTEGGYYLHSIMGTKGGEWYRDKWGKVHG